MRDLHYKFNKAWKRLKMQRDVDTQKYYEGFNLGREKIMFQEELKDLEVVYKTALKNYAKEVEDVLPSLLYYMEKFLTLHKQNETIRDKLEDLMEKTGRQPQDEDGDDE